MANDQKQINQPAAKAAAPKGGGQTSGRQAIAQTAGKSSGSALGAGVRGSLEKAMGGEDLSGVRVHTDGAAAEAAQGLNAKAFTVGQAIFFNEGQYNPESASGKELLGHEVAHTVQQKGAGGDTAQLASMDVSSPGDAHEQQAESFGASFAAGGGGKVTPVSKGVISRAMIQRDLLDGRPPAELQQPPTPVNASQPSTGELAAHAGEAIRNARSQGGTQGVLGIVRTLRSQANGSTAGAVESAISSELTQEEKDALEGKTQQTGQATTSTTPGSTQPHPTTTATPPGHGATPGQQPGHGATPGQPPGHGATPGQQPGGANTEATPGATPGHGATPGQQPGHPGATPGHGPTPGHGATPGQTPGHGATPGQAPGHETPGGHPQPHVSAAGGRELIEQELSFHEQWAAYANNGAGGRALHLLGGMGNDLGQGAIGASTQFVLGQGTKLLTSQTALGRIPGVGNIIGGAFSAYSLFSNGGAGIKEMTHEIGEGIGGAFNANNWRESPWLTAANLVAGIKAVLELVGNVCQILSGLAYAFAAIAALGGLLSIFFPPLAILLPYIPMAINFGRACGGIATVCLNVANLISPIPPILRAIHLIFSNQDPIKLVEQDKKFHSETQGAMAAYGSAAMNSVAAGHNGNPVSAMTSEVREGATTARTAARPGAVQNIRDGLGMSDARLRVAQTEAVVGNDTRNARSVGADYFNPDARAGANHTNLEHAEERKTETETRRDGRQDAVNDAQAAVDQNNNRPNRRALGRAEGKLEEANQRVEHAEVGVQVAEARADGGGRNATSGNAGDMSDAARKRFNANNEEAQAETGTEAYHELRHGQAPVEPTHNARGHVVLPEPPGSLQEIEALDRQIEGAREEEKKLKENATQARTVHTQATTVNTSLTQASTVVQQKVTTEQARSQAEQTRVTGQTTDMRAKTGQANSTTQGGTQQGAGALQPVASAARTVDGLVQRVPSNKFFNVDGTKRNIHQFVVGMDQITGAPGQNQQQNQAATTAAGQRDQQVQQAQQANHAGVAAGQQLQGKMTTDASTARTSAEQAQAVAQTSTSGAQQAGSRAQQLQSQRDQKWQALLGWAANHRALRETAAHE